MYVYLKGENKFHYYGGKALITNNSAQIIIDEVEAYIMKSLNDGLSVDELKSNLINTMGLDYDTVDKVMNNFFISCKDLIEIKESKGDGNPAFYGIQGGVLGETVIFELTNKCNMCCEHCCIEASAEKCDFLDADIIIKNIRLMKGRIKSIQLTGGEPMLHPRFYEILKEAKDNCEEVLITTTGTLINEDNINFFKGAKMSFSLYSDKDDVHDAVTTVKGSYDRVMRSVKLTQCKGMDPIVSFIITDGNYMDYEKFILFCIDNNIKEIRVGVFDRKGRGKEADSKWDISETNKEYIRNMTKELKEKYKDKIILNDLQLWSCVKLRNMEYGLSCNAGIKSWVISSKGKVYPCYGLMEDEFEIGDIYENDVEYIATHWKNNMYSSYKKLSEEGRFDKLCKTMII